MTFEKNHQFVARLLLEYGAETNKKVATSETSLQLAASAGHVSLVRVLIEAGAKVDRSNSRGTAISIASSNGYLVVVQELLSAGASIADPSRIPNALAAACKYRQHSIVEFLLKELFDTDKEESVCTDALSVASFSHDDEMFDLVIEHITKSSSLLRQACAAGLLGSVEMLLESEVDIHNEDGESGPALHVAACHQRSRVVQLLVERGADVDFESAKYGSPLLAALEGCMAPKLRSWARAEPAKSLAKALPLPASLPKHKLILARELSSGPGYKDFAECERIVRTLVNHGADVNTKPGKFGNALHLASFMGSEVIVQLLLNKGANVNATGGYFETALMAALKGNQPVIAELLLSSGINFYYSLSDNGTVLQYARLKQSRAIVRTLLKYGADVNASDD